MSRCCNDSSSASSPSLRLLALAIGALLAAPVLAQETGAGTRDAMYLSPLTSEADEEDDLSAKPAANSQISADEIATFGHLNLDDAVRATAGTYTRDNPQNPGIAVNIRGMEGSGRVAMSIDGVRQNFRFTGHEAQGLLYVDPALLAGVDIRRGAVSTAGGAGALAGAANFRTLGVDDVVDQERHFGGFVDLGWGSNGGGMAPAAAVGFRGDRVGGVFALSNRTPGNYRNGDGDKVLYTGQEVTSALAKLQFDVTEDQRIEIGTVFYDNAFMANSYEQDIESRQYTGRWGWNPDSDLVDLKFNLYRSSVRMVYDRSPLFASGGQAQGRRIRDVGTGFDLQNTSHFGQSVSSTYGIEYFSDRIDSINSAAAPDRGINPSGRSKIASVFSDTTLRFGITEIVLGLRYDRFGVEGSGSVTAANPLGMPPGPYVVDRSQGRFNPKLTLALNPLEWWQPYVTWSRSFRPPTVSELLTGGNHPTSSSTPMSFFPNPYLEPEKSQGWELGNNFRANDVFASGDRLHAKVAYFNNEVEDYVTAMFARGVYFGNNPGQSKVKGIEVEAGYDAGFVFAALGYTDIDSQLPSQVNGFGAQSYIPDRVGSLTLGARFWDQRLSLGTRWSHVSESYVGEVNADDPWEPGYNLVDLFSNYAFANGMELRLNVSNLTDKTYTPALSTPAGGNDIDTGRGRTWSVNLRLPF